MPSLRRLVLSAAMVSAIALGTGACGGGGSGDETKASPGPGASTGSAPVSSPTTSAPSTPSVTPASGLELRGKISSIHAPVGWTADPENGTSFQYGAFPRSSRSALYLQDLRSLGTGGSLGLLYRSEASTLGKGTKPTRLPNVQLGGETPAIHIHYTTAGDNRVSDLIATQRDDRTVVVLVEATPAIMRKDPDLVAEVLASFTWLS